MHLFTYMKPIHFSFSATRWLEPYLLLRRVPKRENQNSFWVACTRGWPGAGPSGTAAPGLSWHPAGVLGAPGWVQVVHTAAAGLGHQLHPFGIQKRRGNEKHQLKAPGLSWGSDTTCSARPAPAQVQAKDKKAEQGKAGIGCCSAGRFGAQTNPRTVEKSSRRQLSHTASSGHPSPRRRHSEHSGEPLMSLKLPRFTCANQKCLLCAKTMPIASSWSSQKPRQCPHWIQGHSRHTAPLCHPLGACPLSGQ